MVIPRVDPSAKTPGRIRRDWGRLTKGAATATLNTSQPITIDSGGNLVLNVAAAGGLSATGFALSVKLAANSGLSLSTGGLAFSTLTTKGDLLGFSTVLTRLPVGTDGQVLVADSSQASGLKWITPTVVSPGGISTSIQVNNTGSFFGDSVLKYNFSTGQVSCTSLNPSSLSVPLYINGSPFLTITGADNLLLGNGVSSSVTTGQQNVAVGTGAFAGLTTGSFNVAIGYLALGGAAGSINESLAFGRFSLANDSGGTNTGLGNTTLTNCTAGFENVAAGKDAGRSITTGTRNTFVGTYSGSNDGVVTTPGTVSLSGAIGWGAQVTKSGCLILGGTGAYAVNVGIGTTAPSSKLSVVGLPTSPSGLTTGDIWVDTTGGLNILKIV